MSIELESDLRQPCIRLAPSGESYEGNHRHGNLPPGGWLSHLWADCLYTGISSRPNAQKRVWENFTLLSHLVWAEL